MEDKIYTVTLPDIGEGVVEGEVIEWLKPVGAAVKQDEPVVVVMTDKATVELPAPYPGIITKHYCQPGELAHKDKPVYDIKLASDVSPLSVKKRVPVKAPPSSKAAPQIQPKPGPSSSPCQTKVLAIPKVRHLANEMGIDLKNVVGSGDEGRITLDDLRKAKEKETISHPRIHLEGDEEKSLHGIQALMAKKMARVIPQFSYFEQVEATRLVKLRENFREKGLKEGMNISFMPFFIRALSLIARKYPLINSSIDMGASKLILHKVHNIGIAFASPHGLVVPVLKGVQAMSMEELIRAYEKLKHKAMEGKFAPSDMREATVTISNFGVLGDGLWATPMVNDPEVAILAIAKIRKAVTIKNDQVVIRDTLPLSWSFDHRVIDGQLAATISKEYCLLIRDPINLL